LIKELWTFGDNRIVTDTAVRLGGVEATAR